MMRCGEVRRVQKIVLVPFVFRAELGVTRAKLLEMRRATRSRCFSSTFLPARSSNYNINDTNRNSLAYQEKIIFHKKRPIIIKFVIFFIELLFRFCLRSIINF